MQRSLLHIVSAGIGAGVASMLYFICLAAGLGHILVVLPVALGGFAAVILLVRRNAGTAESDEKLRFLPVLILAAGLGTILYRTLPHIEKYGGWDAWTIWNMHAKFLCDPRNWKLMFDNGTRAHPDYPLFVPATVAFISRVFRCPVEVASYSLHLAITLALPVIIFLRYQAKNLVVATGALFLVAASDHYVAQGISMYADTALPLFVVCALVCIQVIENRKRAVFFAALSLGCCAWVKNEGVMLCAVMVALYFREFFGGGRVRFFALGMALPLVTLGLFKGGYAPANDLVGGISSSTFAQLTDGGRFKLVFASLSNNATLHFIPTCIALLVLFPYCIVVHRWPDKSVLIVVLALLGYVVTYLLTYLDLEWQLHTSMDRLLHQLMPIAIYSVAGTLVSATLPMWRSNAR